MGLDTVAAGVDGGGADAATPPSVPPADGSTSPEGKRAPERDSAKGRGGGPDRTEGAGCCGGRKRAKPPLMPLDGISIVESFFYKSDQNRPQVIMSLGMRWRAHPDMRVTVPRLLELVQLAAAKHFRLCCLLDPVTLTFRPMGKTAKDIRLNYRIIARQNTETWKIAQREEVNINFDLRNTAIPIWRTAIIVPKHKFTEYETSLAGGPTGLQSPSPPRTLDKDEVPSDGTAPPPPGQQQEQLAQQQQPKEEGEEDSYYEMIFSLHHALGDGLAAFILLRTFLQMCDVKHLNAHSLHLEDVPLSMDMPPIFDNLIKPNFFAVFPAAMEILYNAITRKTKARIKARKLSRPTSLSTEDFESLIRMAIGPGTLALSPEDRAQQPGAQPPATVPPLPPSTAQIVVPAPDPGPVRQPSPQSEEAAAMQAIAYSPRLTHSSTNVKYIWLDEGITEALRKKCKAEKTTITCFVVVNAMAAVRTCFANLPKYAKSGIPSYQGWVITSSLRHLLPNSKLLHGSDKETDPSMNVLGGYAGSLSNASMRLVDKSDFFERCRSIRRYLAFGYMKSIHRMKLLNFCYRHPKLFAYLQRTVDLKKISRTFSVELANLGAWSAPKAASTATAEEQARAHLDEYYGTINASFDGARAIFTLGSITLDGRMSITVAYDTRVVKDREANLFVSTFRLGMERAIAASGKKFTVLDARRRADEA